MNPYDSLRSDAQSVKIQTDDDALRKLADTVSELTIKVKHLEDEITRLKHRFKFL